MAPALALRLLRPRGSGGASPAPASPSAPSPSPPSSPPPSSPTVSRLYDLSAFVAGLYVLERAADAFLDDVGAVARIAAIPEALVALVTAGAEWEELAVVLSAVAERNAPLAYGNIVGSCVSNVLGAFSLALLFVRDEPQTHAPAAPAGADAQDDAQADGAQAGPQPDAPAGAPLTSRALAAHDAASSGDAHEQRTAPFDRSARAAALAQLVLTLLAVALLLPLPASLPAPGAPRADSSGPVGALTAADASAARTARVRAGAVLLCAFAAYFGAAGWAIFRGYIARPEGSDSSGSDTSASGSGSSSSSDAASADADADREDTADAPPADGERTPLLGSPRRRRSGRGRGRALLRRLSRLLLSLLGLSLSGLLLSHSSRALAAAAGLAQGAFGLTLLSVATTLPEKALAVLAGRKARLGIVAAAAAGSNAFLLTLCAGAALLGDSDSGRGGAPAASRAEPPPNADPHSNAGAGAAAPALTPRGAAWLMVSALLLVAATHARAPRRWHGAAMLALYGAFLAEEVVFGREREWGE